MRNLMAAGLVLLTACSSTNGKTLELPSPRAGGGTVVVGTPCVPDLEESPTFAGFALQEASVQSDAAQASGAAVCVAFHFQGLVTCPYGRNAGGGSPSGMGCETSNGQPVLPGAVAPQCVNHRAADAVTWSCRCENVKGQTDDGDAYCSCPMSTTCTHVLNADGATASALSGGYCVPTRAFAAGDACSAECDPTTHPCN